MVIDRDKRTVDLVLEAPFLSDAHLALPALARAAREMVVARYDLGERVQQEIAFSQRHGSPLALIIFDLDDFKFVNDMYGHPAGDAMLIE